MRCKPNIFESSVFTRLVRLCLILSEKLKKKKKNKNKNKNIIKKINKFKFITTINENQKNSQKIIIVNIILRLFTIITNLILKNENDEQRKIQI